MRLCGDAILTQLVRAHRITSYSPKILLSDLVSNFLNLVSPENGGSRPCLQRHFWRHRNAELPSIPDRYFPLSVHGKCCGLNEWQQWENHLEVHEDWRESANEMLQRGINSLMNAGKGPRLKIACLLGDCQIQACRLCLVRAQLNYLTHCSERLVTFRL
ncbi:hypothetical protein SAMN04515647_0479 [Cohaesibacter sp. ES.047]|nr:hypothetical protein SAMN04515647_0479 [Cohaesibacter sp. ES.047]